MFLLTNEVNIGPSVDVKGHAQAIDRSKYENSTRTAHNRTAKRPIFLAAFLIHCWLCSQQCPTTGLVQTQMIYAFNHVLLVISPQNNILYPSYLSTYYILIACGWFLLQWLEQPAPFPAKPLLLLNDLQCCYPIYCCSWQQIIGLILGAVLTQPVERSTWHGQSYPLVN